MSDWETRVQDELIELQVRSGKLEAFMETEEYDALSGEYRAFMLLQAFGMSLYAQALKLRLAV